MILALALAASTASAVEVTWTGSSGHATNPQWSSDGKWLAFEVNNNSDKVDLYVVQVSAGAPGTPARVQIPGSSSSFASGGTYAANPAWHPKQPIVIFEAANQGGTMRLYSASPSSPSAAAEFLNAATVKGSLAWPSFSADASLAFTSSQTGKGDVYVYQGGKVSPSVVTEAPETAPRFATDNKTLVFSKKDKGTEDLYAWAPGDAQQRLLAGAAGDQTRPRVVGTSVVYFTNERGDDKWDIAVVPLAGGDRKILARDVRLPQHSAPAVSPDGTWIIYGSSAPAQDGVVHAVKIDGSSSKQVTTGGLSAVGDPTVVKTADKVLLSFTCLPKVGSDWRQLHVLDVSGQF